MNKLLLLVFFTLLSVLVKGQEFEIDTILWNGEGANRVNLVILGDGYTASEQDKFIQDAEEITDHFFQTTPYQQYQAYFNVVAVKVVSNESGASHGGVSSDNACGSQPVKTVDNYFGSAFDCGNQSYHRLLCAKKGSAINQVLASHWPTYDQTLILVNSIYYGGAGGNHPVSSTNSSAAEISVHEVGHSFAYLADEYWAGQQYATDAKPNMTSNSDINTVKWNNWVGEETVGLYPHSGNANWFKPVTGKCKMERLGTNYPFCPVCREAHILEFLDLVIPYDSYSPEGNSSLGEGESMTFQLDEVAPNPNTLKFSWYLNGEAVVGSTSALELSFDDLIAGENEVSVVVLDTTAMIRSASHVSGHSYQLDWLITKDVNTYLVDGIKENGLAFQVYPNPSEGNVFVRGSLDASANVEIELVDSKGGVKRSQLLSGLKPGEFEVAISNEGINLPSGVYFLKLKLDGVPQAVEKIVVK